MGWRSLIPTDSNAGSPGATLACELSRSSAAATAVVQDTEFQQQTWAWLPPARFTVVSGFISSTVPTAVESAANFYWFSRNNQELQQRLLQRQQILIRDCLSFPELGDPLLR